MNESKGFISVGIDMQEVRNILSRLDQDKREKALKDALKQTAEKARNRLAKKAQDSYTIKNAGFKKAMKIRSGKNRAVIYAEGEPIPLNKFKKTVQYRTGFTDPYHFLFQFRHRQGHGHHSYPFRRPMG